MTGYRGWLEQQRYDSGTVDAQMFRAERVEKYYGDLDDHYSSDRMLTLIDALRYSAADERHKRPIPESPRDEEHEQSIGLERDMPAALRIEIGQLEPGLTIIDEGSNARSTPASST